MGLFGYLISIYNIIFELYITANNCYKTIILKR